MPIYIFIPLCIGVVFIGVVGVVASGWRSDRMVFLDPYNDGAGGYGAGYQLIRSYYAFAQGGFFGVGLGNSYEKYQYLPEAETDFIFAIIGEELGMFGCLIVISLFAALIISGIIMVARSNSRFWASVSGSFVIMIGFQAFLNIICVVGLFATTGKPLPFISAGGSSLVATLVMVGFILKGSEVEAAQPDKYERRRANFRVSTSAPRSQSATKTVERKTSTQRKARTSATRGVKRTPNIKDPKFLDTRERRQPAKKAAPKKSGSYAYRRNNSGVSFKPTKSAVKRDSSRRR